MADSGASDSGNILDDIFELNSYEEMEICSLSVANAPVVVIDNLYRKPELVRQFALSLDFHHKAGYYPGGYAFISYQSRKLLGLCNYALRDKLDRRLIFNPGYKDTAFGQIWTPAEELIPVQKQPHYDYFSDYGGVVYLNPNDDGSSGTSFWRHVKTGLEDASFLL